MTIEENIEVHDELNPKLFSGNKLKEEVRDKLLEVVQYFKDTFTIDFDIADVWLCGSNASYNYSQASDIDCHILVDYTDAFLKNHIENDTLDLIFNLKKSAFNTKHNVVIKGLEVELYVQDIHSKLLSNGIYSVLKDAWIKEPEKIDNIPEFDNSREIQKWTTRIEQALYNKDKDEISKIIDTLYIIRKNALAADGEFSKGNYIFKDIRNIGLLDKLKDMQAQLDDKELSLESLK